MLKHLPGFIMIMVASLCITTAVVAGPNMQEEKWEIQGGMKMEGMPLPMPAVPISFSQCITK